MKFEKGDRVMGLACHRGKTGTVIGQFSLWVKLQWDGGKRVSSVDYDSLKKIEETDDGNC
jgi:hypothetical protein